MTLAFAEKIELGYKAPLFNLPEPLSGQKRSLNELRGKIATVVMFICNHCPYVKHINSGLVKLASDYINRGVSFIAISSNDANRYTGDAPEMMAEIAKEQNYPFPYLYDEAQDAAKAYGANCTPDFSIFNNKMNCVYRGQMDAARPGNSIPVSGFDIRAALDAICKKEPIANNQVPSAGCSIKWK